MLKYKIPQIVTLTRHVTEMVTEKVSVFFVVPWYKQ